MMLQSAFLDVNNMNKHRLDNDASSNCSSLSDLSGGSVQAYQIATPTSIPQGVVMATAGSTITSQQQLTEEAQRKRELRLLKNRDAARDCRRKKKDYIKCLETRVTVLENQNKCLIAELKSLKELYCQQDS